MPSNCNDGCGEGAAYYAGDTWDFDVELAVDGLADDLTGAALVFTLKSDPADADVEAVLQVTVNVPAGEDAANGIARLSVPSDVTAIAAGTYYFRLRRIRPGTPPNVWTIDAGQLKVEVA